ncbi:ABC transporter permease [Salinibacterium sp. SYSU T00001]|uniref:ABC transporter permease n=1 Tax=Homoserinimonas sedimenticola TaxID=2986805 RepID=UPI0022367ED2|nr:ABC transporter permease [Salinibacterium sedimenticola]MCW4384668.1 ABC transporter permease [Salinibacterium sedimenticola]
MSGARRVLRWLAVRLAGAVFVLWSIATLIFFALRLVPGDPALAILGGPGSQASEEALALVRQEYGLDRPVSEQYLLAMGRLLVGDLGTSYSLRQDVLGLIAEQFWGTLLLTVLALATAWLLALGLATWATRGSRAGRAVASALEIVAAAVPHFWLASVLILLFSTTLGMLPPVSVPGPLGLVLPVVTLALPLAGFLAQVMRESLADALESPFALSARARGESETGVRLRHAVRHAALPAISLSGWAFGSLISGAVVVETVFARPGLGRSLLKAVTDRDIPLVTGIALVSALAFVLVTIATDALDRVADPRLRGS